MEEAKPSLQQQQQDQSLSQSLRQQLQQKQLAISRFPSNIDAHLIPPGTTRNPPNTSTAPNPQLQQQKGIRAQAPPPASQPEMQLAYQDAWKVCHPEINRPFESLEDACERLLPYHVVADYEAEEDDRILDSDTTGQVISRSQQWDNNIAAKVAEFTATFEKQALAFNIISRKRTHGEFRSEERLMIEQALLQEEKRAVFQLKAEIESREKAGRVAQLRMAEAMVQAEQARGDPQATRGPLRGSAVGSQGSENEGSEREHGINNPEEMMNGWGNNVQRDEREPSEDFLNDEETENGETSGQHEWHEVGAFDLNSK